MGAGHVGLGPGLVDKDQAGRVDALLVMAPAFAFPGDVGPILLNGMQTFF
jgi:hypothetical protein